MMANHRIMRSLVLLCALVAPAATLGLSGTTMSGIWDPPSRRIATMAKAAPPQPKGFQLEPKQVAIASTAGFLAVSAALGCAPQTIAGLVTALVVTAPVNILDIAIMENASGKRSMIPALTSGLDRLKASPADFAKSPESALVYTLFAFTFATANICKATKLPAVAALGLTTAANMGACFYKDSELARLCGKGPARSFPFLGFVALASRDVVSMGCAFTLPPFFGKALVNAGMSNGPATTLAQILVPVLGQTVQVPFHLVALSLYNKPELDLGKRLKLCQSQYWETLGARMARAFPVYGAGGVLNTGLQARFVATAARFGAKA
mmetsp:Transcript_51491/g.122619  ORF Transcript_51491/g.122619 Transcript_51491/m.122619 type:complete len:323 (-) Transcript_51491:270-1238(-)|eukprot:CAMPEP_0180141914 /NCGR_PEP_ID=MMETSP0986-20121125/15238_1 /TAXON_ID=697907 /ORGANISM="non described non described, Strain CCMP2293" /LENGTH=322 /DNA_ID=CAMNT_0022084951 /DNA_START=69 /DNA_END=1037 /DNA_ORIENTATION=-